MDRIEIDPELARLIRGAHDVERQAARNRQREIAWRTRRWYHQTRQDTPPLVLIRCTLPTDWMKVIGRAIDIVVGLLILTGLGLAVATHWG